jgi:hypothetical protein
MGVGQMRASIIVVLLLAVWACCPNALGQAYPTNNVLFRIGMVESEYGRGTIFSIDVDGREYWVTAKHIITGAKHPPYGSVDTTKPVSLKLLDPSADEERWITVRFSAIDAGKDVDIVALAPPNLLLQNPLPNASFEYSGIMLGGDCSFLGFPFGGGWHIASSPTQHGYWMPFVKHCTVSSFPVSGVLILDGINNPGFSGGPVLYQTGPNQKIVAVISGYEQEPAEVIPSAQRRTPPPPASHGGHVNLNSGFIIAYLLDPVITAIRKNPIGPQRPPQTR